MGYRALPHVVTTGTSPAMLMFGRQLSSPADLKYGIPFKEAIQKYSGDYAKEFARKLWELREITR